MSFEGMFGGEDEGDFDLFAGAPAAAPAPSALDASIAAIVEQWGLDVLDTIPTSARDRSLMMKFPIEFLRRRRLVPLRDGDDGYMVAVADPVDVFAFDAVANALPGPCRRVVCGASAIDDALTATFFEEGTTHQIIDELGGSDAIEGVQSGALHSEDLLSDAANRPPIIRLVNAIFFQAIESRASDIHLEPYESELRVRFRVDGVLREWSSQSAGALAAGSLPKQHAAAVVSRLKIMAELDIAERRLPQDGRSRVRIGDRQFDIRMSTVPTAGGERVVLRLLDKTTVMLDFQELGLGYDNQERLRRLLDLTQGIVLLTGPTGSGKTTTLYTLLSRLNTLERNILTVEDPVEYNLPGIGQIPVQPKIGLTFASALRNILRQDPDVIMVGEIRDVETAEMAIQAALTGHLVLSTLHTNDAPSAFTRLIEMGIEPFLVSSSVAAIMAQRLVRLICLDCCSLVDVSDDVRQACETAAIELSADHIPVRGQGCSWCGQTGYRGRNVICELLVVDDDIRQLVLDRASAPMIQRSATSRGRMSTLLQDGLRKVAAGVTSMEEVRRVTQREVADS